MTRGKFITIEGGEGVGKSTQLNVIREALEARGFEVQLTREPGGTPRAEEIRKLLLQQTSESMPPICELLLMFAARATHIANFIEPALRRGAWVVCDRFTDASYAYQGAGRGISHDFIAVLENTVQGTLRPDLTLLLDVPLDVSLARVMARRQSSPSAEVDRFEREQQAFFERVRAEYLRIAKEQSERVVMIDATADVATVSERIRTTLVRFIDGR